MILIVDDNQENVSSFKSFLELHKFKFEVDCAYSGQEALKKIFQDEYELIILDVQMPDMDGFEVADAISVYSKSRNIPIIFLSSENIDKKSIAKCYTSGMIDYLTKPYDPDVLLLKIKTFYRLSRQTRQLNALEKTLREEIELRKQAEIILEKKVDERTKELKRSNQKLVESNKLLQQFAFIASHDLQEPLRKIEIFSQAALLGSLNENSKTKFYLDKILSSASRLRDLITDLLSYSMINVEDVFKKTNLNTVIDETLADLEFASKPLNPIIEITQIPEIEVIPSQMRQVFQNLLSNAFKFSRTGTRCTIKINAERVNERSIQALPSADGEYCKITVSDNGIGFNNAYKERIFEIFQRLNNRGLYEGTGIGLAIVKKVIERHEGIISAYGWENEGATFIIVLPIQHLGSSNISNEILLF